MTSEAISEWDAKYEERIRKIREAAATTLKELDQLRSGGLMVKETLDGEVARIARERLHPHGCDLVVDRMGDGVTRFLIKVQPTGTQYDLIKGLLHRDDGR